MDSRTYDIIVYGASGFTGKFAAVEAVKTCKGKKIAIAGRSKSKLEDTLARIESDLGGDSYSQVGIVIADNKNPDSIREMCQQAKVIVNCVGPFRWYGELVVKSCVEMGTNYVDITGEPEFMQSMQIKYNEEAKQKGIHIVSACGFDSIPADIGLEILREKFPGVLTGAESYIHVNGDGKINYGTYLTLIHSIQNRHNVRKQHKAIFQEKIQYRGKKIGLKNGGYSNSEKKWFIPFLGADPSVVKRTQYFESMNHGRMPVQYFAYFTMPSILHILCLMIFGVILFVLTKFSFGIKLLEKYPGFFSFGTFKKDGPTMKEIESASFKFIFHGQGYANEENLKTSSDPDVKMSLKISGPDLGYVLTSTCVIAAASTILDDTLINKGGVLTPGSAFRKTKFVERLQARNVKIEVMN